MGKIGYLLRRIVSFSYGAPADTRGGGNQDGHQRWHWIGFRPMIRRKP